MSIETYPMAGYTDTGTTPHWVARLHPNEACCNRELTYIPLIQKAWDEAMVCRQCRRSGVTPLPHDHDPTKDMH